MPRRSAADLTTPRVVTRTADHRPSPPEDLNEAAAAEWTAITKRMPPDWFQRESWPLLRAFCGHVVSAQQIQRLLDSFDPAWASSSEGLDRLNDLLRIRERESRILATLATKLRLSHQARYMPDRAARALAAEVPDGPAPWEPVTPKRRARKAASA